MNNTPQMTAMRPYLVRGLIEWINDNKMSPYVLVDANVEGTVVPKHLVKDGKIIFNLSPQAVSGMNVSHQHIEFSARFSGQVFQVWLPMGSIQAVFANETGLGMGMPIEQNVSHETPPEPPVTPDSTTKENKRAHLRVVK